MPTTPPLRASVTADSPVDMGGPAFVLVDGSDTPVTANGLTGYQPTPGDRLLVVQVGSQVEILQFLSRGAVPTIDSYDGPIAPDQITSGTMDPATVVKIGSSTDPYAGASDMYYTTPSVDTTDPLNPVNVGGWVIDDPANPGQYLVQFHPAGSFFHGQVITDLLTVLTDLIVNGLMDVESGASILLHAGISTPPAPTLSSGPATGFTWPAIPSGYTEAGICWDTTNSQWWQLLNNTSSARTYFRTISIAGVAGVLKLAALNPDTAHYTLLLSNSVTYYNGKLYVWQRELLTPGGIVNHDWSSAVFDVTTGAYDLTAALGYSFGDESPTNTYPASYFMPDGSYYYQAMKFDGDSFVTVAKVDPAAGTIVSAKISLSGIPDVPLMRSMAVGNFDTFTGTQILQIATRSGSVYHFDIAGVTWATTGTPPTLARHSSYDFTVDTAGDWLAYNDEGLTKRTVTNKAATTTVATLITSVAHNFLVGQVAYVNIGDTRFDGAYVVTGTPSSTTFTYAATGSAVSSTGATGTASVDGGFFSSASGSLKRYSAYYPSASEKHYAKYEDTDAPSTHHTAVSPVASLAVPARRFVNVGLRPAPPGVTGADLWVGYGTSTPATYYRRAEALTGRSFVLLAGKNTAGSITIPAGSTMGGLPAFLASETGGLQLNGDGTMAAPLKMQGRRAVSVTIPVGSSNVSQSVSFPVAFPVGVIPVIQCTLVSGSAHGYTVMEDSSPAATNTGFNVNAVRYEGAPTTSAVTLAFNWTAIAP